MLLHLGKVSNCAQVIEDAGIIGQPLANCPLVIRLQLFNHGGFVSPVEAVDNITPESLFESIEGGCYFCKSLWNATFNPFKNDPTINSGTNYALCQWGENGYSLGLASSDEDGSIKWGINMVPQDSVKAAVIGRKTEVEAEKADLSPAFDAEQVKAWMQGCENDGDGEHIVCAPQTRLAHLPSRLLDLGEKDSMTFKLVVMDTNEAWDGKLQYTTLSYMPEHDAKLTLIEATMNRLLAGGLDADVDHTIRRAFQITRGIGFRYMWIPSLCVQQDSEREVADCAAYMCDRYLLSSLHLVSSPTPWEPLAEISDNAFVRLAKDVPGSGSAKDYIAIHDDWWDHNVSFLPIYRQPNDFAMRCVPGSVLHFDHWSGQIFFSCRAYRGRASSIFPGGVPEVREFLNRSLQDAAQECLMMGPVDLETMKAAVA